MLAIGLGVPKARDHEDQERGPGQWLGQWLPRVCGYLHDPPEPENELMHMDSFRFESPETRNLGRCKSHF